MWVAFEHTAVHDRKQKRENNFGLVVWFKGRHGYTDIFLFCSDLELTENESQHLYRLFYKKKKFCDYWEEMTETWYLIREAAAKQQFPFLC